MFKKYFAWSIFVLNYVQLTDTINLHLQYNHAQITLQTEDEQYNRNYEMISMIGIE